MTLTLTMYTKQTKTDLLDSLMCLTRKIYERPFDYMESFLS